MDERIMEELKIQTAALLEVAAEIRGLREDMRVAQRKGLNESMAQIFDAFKGTPMEAIMASMASKMKLGGSNG